MDEKDLNMTIKMGAKSFGGIYDLSRGRTIDESQIEPLCAFLDARFDCADFRATVLLKALYAYSDVISEGTCNRIKGSLLNFKYWMDEPGEDSMCYWSENHQLLFHTCAYLAGSLYKDEVFTNSGMKGSDHVIKSKPRLLKWFEHKWHHGFIEWHSNTYYEEDLAPLALLVDYAEDEEIRRKAKLMMDLLFLDLAMFSYDGYFSSTSGRCYEDQKKDGNAQDTLDLYRWAFEEGYEDFDYERLSSVVVLSKGYKVPEIIKAIAKDRDSVIIKDSVGFRLKDLYRTIGNRNMEDAGAIQWQMESFTNPETIHLSMKMFRAYGMRSNVFLKGMEMIDHPLLTYSGVLPGLIRLLNPSTRGVVIQQSNNYVMKTPSYMLSTSMRYHPGEFGDQHHIWHAALPGNVQVFTTHPGAPFFDDNARNFSPSYWVGNGILPDSVQHENIHLSIYKVDQRKGFLERERLEFSHAYFPGYRMDEVHYLSNRVFGRVQDTYIQLIGLNPIEKKDADEWVQKGKVTAWVCEVTDAEHAGTFVDYMEEAKRSNLEMDGLRLRYKHIEFTYKGSFKVDGHEVPTAYERLESKYGSMTIGDQVRELSHEGMTYRMEF